MASLNRVILMGNVTRDVELRYTQGGTAVTDLGLAVNDRVKKNGEWVDEATFVDVTLWGRTAEIAGEYLSKGSPVLIEGRLKLDTWEQDGQKRSKLHVVGERMQMVGSRSGSGGGGSGGGASGGGGAPSSGRGSSRGAPQTATADRGMSDMGGDSIPEDDIPF